MFSRLVTWLNDTTKTPYDQLQEENETLEHQFRIYGGLEEENGIELLSPRKPLVGGILSVADAQKISLEKKNLVKTDWKTKTGSVVSHKLDLVNKDGEYATTIWTTKPKNIQKALRSGLFDPSEIKNPLAKMLAQIGEYKKHLHDDLITKKTYPIDCSEKIFIAETTQDCLAALNGLHSYINNYNESLSPRGNLQIIINKVEALLAEIEQLKLKTQDEGEPYETFREGLGQLIENIQAYRGKLGAFQSKGVEIRRENLENDIQRPYGLTIFEDDLSIQHFLQEQINEIFNFSAGANNTLTSTTASLMGRDSLTKALLEARITGEKFSNTKIDYHNPVTARHAYDFSGLENEEGLVSIDTEKFGFKPKNKLDLLKGLDQFRAIDRNENQLLRGTKGEEQKKFRQRALEFGSELLRLSGNLVKDIIAFPLDLGYGLVYGGNAKFPSSHWASLHKRQAEEAAYLNSEALSELAQDLNEKTELSDPGFTEWAFKKLAKVASVLVSDPLRVVFLELPRILSNLTVDTYQDFSEDSPLDLDQLDTLISECIEEDEANETANKQAKISFIESYNNAHEQDASFSKFVENAQLEKINKYKNKGDIRQASVPYHLTPDDPCDTVSWAANDFLREIVEVFSHEIYRAHPLPGLAFTVAAGTAAPMLAPGLLQYKVLNLINSNISVPLAHTFIGAHTTGFMPALSTGLIQGKLAFLLVDLKNGGNSLLGRGLKAAAENPVLTFSLLSAAVGFGYAIAFKMSIPGLSMEIADETEGASVPYVELGLTGAKIAAVLIENAINLERYEHTPVVKIDLESLIEEQREQLMKDIELGYKRENKITKLKPQDQDAINNIYQNYCEEFKKHFKEVELAKQAQKLSAGLNKEFGVDVDEAIKRKISATVKPLDEVAQRKERIINNLMRMSSQGRNKNQIRKILDSLRVNFPNDEKYIKSVEKKLEHTSERGPIYNSLKILFTNLAYFFRMAASTAQWYGFNRKTKKLEEGSPERSAVVVQGALAERRIGDYFEKTKNDFWRAVKAGMSILRKAWDLPGAALHNFLEVTMILSGNPRLAKIRSSMSKEFFSPGTISRSMDALVGYGRASDSAKNLNLASRDLVTRERMKNQVLEIVSAAASKDSEATKPIVIGKRSAKQKNKTSSSSTSVMQEALRAEGHDWQVLQNTAGARYRTFPKSAGTREIGAELKKLWEGASTPTKRIPTVASKTALLPGQTRATELSNSTSKALVIETLTPKKNEVVSEIIYSEEINLGTIYKQLKSGIDELNRHSRSGTGDKYTITINSEDPSEVQQAYLLSSIKLGCSCWDEKGEIYNPDFEETEQIILGGETQSLAELREEYEEFLSADFESSQTHEEYQEAEELISEDSTSQAEEDEEQEEEEEDEVLELDLTQDVGEVKDEAETHKISRPV